MYSAEQQHINRALEVAKKFERISLKEMDSVELMNRTDTKFAFNIEKLSSIFEDALPMYRILEIENQVGQPYESTYFDTCDFEMFRAHQSGRTNRFKIRRREYMLTGTNFLEVKQKVKGRTEKSRIKKKLEDEHFDENTSNFVCSVTQLDTSSLEPKLKNSFLRFMLVNTIAKERITVDVDLAFSNDVQQVRLPFLCIVEVKQEGFSRSSAFIQLLKHHGVCEGSISKYCVGTVLLYPQLKHNRFKPKMLTLKKISNDSKYSELFTSNN